MSDERLFDLVRYARGFLWDENLISADEFTEILTTDSINSVKRLETYDMMRVKLADLTAERDKLRAALHETREALADTLDLATRVAICEMEAMASKEPGSDVFGCAGIAEKAKVARARAAWKAFDDCVKPVLARYAGLVEEVGRG